MCALREFWGERERDFDLLLCGDASLSLSAPWRWLPPCELASLGRRRRSGGGDGERGERDG